LKGFCNASRVRRVSSVGATLCGIEPVVLVSKTAEIAAVALAFPLAQSGLRL